MSDRAIADAVELFLASVVIDALRNASVDRWLRRAEDFERAKPDLGRDYRGRATSQELRAAWRRCRDTAEACRQHAQLLASYDDPSDAVGLDETDVLKVWEPIERRAAA